ncbi:hypothetical protein D915_007860 [Fasciola hepatica]|uniref:Uncharacterized protein n=1 Tax=Fasciola hepatica TaxID=6192 RepID=A0A4E0RUZ5_FASHE|nr:hypothetical protein D915_007860 [Fasciola hepatica]
MSLESGTDNPSLEADIASAKLCNQPACRRVSSHCSHLLDALIVFKAWFIQRQNDIKSTAEPSHHSPPQKKSSIEATICRGPPKELHGPSDHPDDSEVPTNILLQRDWALSRMKRAESQLSRLRSACLTMRVQIEAGLRYKSEVDLVKRELELVRDTVHHYKNLIDEGNRLRDDLRSELARMRKEASTTRAQLNSSQSHAFDLDDQPATSTPRTRRGLKQKSHSRANITSRMSAETRSRDAQSSLYMRTQLERYIRWCDSLNEEVIKLRESLRDSTEKELLQTKRLEVVRKRVLDLVEYVCTLEARRNNRSMRLAEIALNFRWLGDLAQLIGITLPDNFATLIIEDSRVCTDTLKVLCAKKSRSDKIHNKKESDLIELTEKDTPEISCESNVDIDADIFNETLGLGMPVGKHCAEHSHEPKGVSTPSSPVAPSVEYFFSDSESSVSDHEAQIPSSSLTTTPTTMNPSAPSSDLSRSSSTNDTGERRRPKRSRKSSDTFVTQLTASSEQKISPFKTPLSRPSKTRRTSVGENVQEIPPSIESSDRCPSSRLRPADSNSLSCTDPVSSSGSTKKIKPDTAYVRRMRTRIQSTSSGHSSSVPCPVREHPNQFATISKASGSSPTIDDHTHTWSESIEAASPVEVHDLHATTDHIPSSPTNFADRTQAADTKEGSVNPSEALLALLKPRYSDEIIKWFDRLSKEEPQLSNSPIPATTVSWDSTIVKNASSKPRDGKIPLFPDANYSAVSTSKAIPLEISYSDFLLGGAVTPPVKLVTAMLSSSDDTVYRACWLGFVDALRTSRTEESRSRVETKFISMWHTIAQKKIELDSHSTLTRHLFDSLSSLCLNHTRLFHAIRATFHLSSLITSTSVQFSRVFFVQLIRYLFLNCCDSSHQGLTALPVILDASIQGFKQMWHSTKPLRDAAASQFHATAADPSYSYWIATLQSLVAWQEAHFDRNKANDIDKCQAYDAVLARLHVHGWLPGPRPTHPVTVEHDTCGLISPQCTHRVRLLTLRLVDACLCVTRQRSSDVPLALDHTCLRDNKTVEAACSLTVLLSAMIFVIGNATVMDDAQSGKEQNSGSQGLTHQRKRRYRQTQRQQRYGLLGWLLTSRLMPWLSSCLKSLDANNGVPQGEVSIVDRLAILITDVLVLGSVLLGNLKSSSHAPGLNDLRTILFDSGRRAIRLIGSCTAVPHMTWRIKLVCLARLFAFDPAQVMQLITNTKNPTPDELPPNVVLSILWPEVSMLDLLGQVLVLAQRTVPRLPATLVQEYRNFYNAKLKENPLKSTTP